MALPNPKPRKPLLGSPIPRIGPPTPARTLVKEFEAEAESVGLKLIPWQSTVGRYLYALAQGEQWLYPEVACVVSRQNGKTEMLLPHVKKRLRMGRRILHAAQTRELPRKFFFRLIPFVVKTWPDAKIRRGAGQETIELPNGGVYQITAATGGGPRGVTVDDLLLDELRELDEDFVGAALPTLTVSPNPQVLYLSNAGEDKSDVLNAVRSRADADPSLAYLEWSAAPDLAPDDRAGWAQANPSLGHFPQLVNTLERAHRAGVLSGNLARFETEHLCRWVSTMREKLVDDVRFREGKVASLGRPIRPVLAVSMDPEGRRASIAQAWQDGEYVNLRLLYDVTGSPIDTDRLGSDLKNVASTAEVGFDPYTDAELIKYVRRSKSINGLAYANASAQFVNLVTRGKVRWVDAEPVATDLALTARKPTGEGSYLAVRMKDDVPITAALAAIRAVYLASGHPTATPRVM